MALEVSAFRVDARGKACPWPIIELAKALKDHPQVELWADDPATRADLEAYCQATGATVQGLTVSSSSLCAVVLR